MAFNNVLNANQTGFQSLSSSGAWNGRTLTEGTGISITNADGVSGNPVISQSGGGGGGGLLQLSKTRSTTPLTYSKSFPSITTTPTTSNTTTIINLDITPSDASNILEVRFMCSYSANVSDKNILFFIFQDSVFKSGFIGKRMSYLSFNSMVLMDYLTAGTTSSTNIEIRSALCTGTDTIYIIESYLSGTQLYGSGNSAITLTVSEMSP